MTLDSEIRDQAYQFFIEEAPELLEAIETGLIHLHADASPARLHTIMRAAHSIKGGAAGVGLQGIKSLAHRLETIVKALYGDQVHLDTTLENQLLQAYDCLRLPLEAQIDHGDYDEGHALATAEPIFQAIEQFLGPALAQADNFIPSSSELGVDMVAALFEVDVQQGLERLQRVVEQPHNHEPIGELRAQTEVFSGFAEILNLPGFGQICAVANRAVELAPDNIIAILQQSIVDLTAAREVVLSGDRDQGGIPSPGLLALAQLDSAPVLPQFDSTPVTDNGHLVPVPPQEDYDLSDILGEPISDGDAESQIGAEDSPAESWLGDPVAFADIWDVPNGDPSTNGVAADDDTFIQDESDLAALFQGEDTAPAAVNPPTLDAALQSIKDHYETLAIAPPADAAIALSGPSLTIAPPLTPPTPAADEVPTPVLPRPTARPKPQTGKSLTARIALDRLERMDNYVGELVINRNGLSLQNEQFQRTVRHLKQRFKTFRTLAKQLQTLSDKILTNPERINLAATQWQNGPQKADLSPSPLLLETQFDALELDTYSAVNPMLEELLEELLQVEESIEDVHLFAGQSNQKLEKQRQLLTRLRDELMWSRMVPLSEVLNRFPRILRELSSSHHKPVQLELKGTEVLVDRVMLEKLYDPLMHLLRNAFDHGIESPEERRQQGKSEQGTIEIRAYHQGNNTVIDVRDDGHGLDLQRIGQRAVEAGLLAPGDVPTLRKQQLYKAIFEPGFSTAAQVTDLSGRGVGLDVVRDRLQSFNGKVSVVSEPGQGTTFTLRIPLTLTLAKLIVVRVGTALMALSSDGIEEIVTPLDNQMKESAGQRFLLWRNQLVPAHGLEALQPYACAIPDAAPDMPLASRYRAKKPLLIMRREHEALALEVDQIITEQELVIKPFSKSIAAPSYMNGCTVLGDGRLVPVIDAIGVVDYVPKGAGQITQPPPPFHADQTGPQRSLSPTLLIIDDSAALRRTLALTLQKAGYRVIQAKDGREALEQLQQGREIQLIICDIEMPRMNGFEFLSQKRLTPAFASIPTIMLTSRSSQKHRMLALQLGADSYFSKPYIEADFLSALKTHLKTALTTV